MDGNYEMLPATAPSVASVPPKRITGDSSNLPDCVRICAWHTSPFLAPVFRTSGSLVKE